MRVDLEMEILKALQEGHGGWNPKMEQVIGMIGVVHRVTEKNDVRVSFEDVSLFLSPLNDIICHHLHHD